MTSLELQAWSRLDCELSHEEAAAIRATGLVDVFAEPGDSSWRLVSGSRVGVAAGPTWELRVNPRLAVPQLFFLLAYALDPVGWKDEEATFAAAPRLFDAIAAGFSWHALTVVEQGPLRGYVEVEERLRTVRGRIRFGDQIARSADLPLPIEVSYDDYTADIPENRLLKAATLALLRLPRIPGLARRRLLTLRAMLDEVADLARPHEAPMPPFTRLNERYRKALRLAQLTLRASSLSAEAGPNASVAFAFDMNRVFEDFLSTALREAFLVHGGELRAQARSSLDLDGRVPIRPDVTWWVDGRVRAVIDAKHKSLGAPAEDVYQMLAYCTALGLEQGFLVYAAGDEADLRDHSIRNADCEVRVRTVDLRQTADELLADVDALAGEVSRAALPAA